MRIFDNPNFYPTPEEVINRMLGGVSFQNKVIFEPSGGSGNIIDYLKQNGAKEVLTCELDEELSIIAAQKADVFLHKDFYETSREEISHINMIIANPPFSDDVDQILNMWDIAPDGCEIISLCNWETLDHTYTTKRRKLKSIIDNNGYKECFGECFKDSDRQTDVKVGYVRLFKPKQQKEDEWEGYFDLSEEYQSQQEGLIQHNEILELVNRYVGAVKMFDEVNDAQNRLNELTSPISHYEHKIEFKAVYSDSNKKYNDVTREVFKKELQKGAWKNIFEKFDMDRFVTQSVMEKLNKFIEQQSHVPFSVKNIYKMLEVIAGTHGNTMKQVIIEVFDWLTAHHKENRMSLEGWKTNSEYVVNKKFIAPYCGVGFGSYGNPQISWSRGGNRMDDLTKALCWLTGTQYDKKNSIENFFCYGGEPVEYEKVDPETERDDGYSYLEDRYTWEDSNYKKHRVNDLYKFKEEESYLYRISTGYNKGVVKYKMFGKWYDWRFFKVKVFKKGTMHVIFKDEKVWGLFNRESAKAKGFQLASKFTSDFRKKSTGVEVYEN